MNRIDSVSKCQVCGKDYAGNGLSKYCYPCKMLKIKESWHRADVKRRAKNKETKIEEMLRLQQGPGFNVGQGGKG